jgi:hypothetical protein
MTLSIAAITKLLSDRGTNNLGCFEKKFMFDPIGEAAHTRYGRALTGEFSLSICLSEKV